MVRFLILALAVLVNSLASGQEVAAIQQRCEAILIEAINADPVFHGPEAFSAAILLCKYVPVERIEDRLREALASDRLEVRLVAAEVALGQSRERFREAIVSALDGLQTTTPSEAVRRSVVLMNLGDAGARKEVEAWASHDPAAVRSKVWMCPMVCTDPAEKQGNCPVCKMELVLTAPEFDYGDWKASLLALRALRQDGKQVAENARSIVVSDASAFIRLRAAGIWAEEKPREALPHIKVYLHSGLREFALSILAEEMPRRCVAEFEGAIEDPSISPFGRWAAYRGLVRAGRKDYLKKARKLVDGIATARQEETFEVPAIWLLGELAQPEDVNRLERLLDTPHKVTAAKVLVRHWEKDRE